MERLLTSELARAGGVNLQTLRYYEREGLLPRPPRTAAGYREFPKDAVDLIRFIKRAQGLGFTLREIKELIALRDHPATACEEVRRQAEAKVTEITQKIRHLQSMKRELSRFAQACAGRARPHTCPLLEALETTGD
jgi:Hg(II)-responsive transcriptional regulator